MPNIHNIQLPDFPLLLAPMENITDSSFRLICKFFGADLVFTEFVASEGIIRQIEKSKSKLIFREAERPIAAQIFGNNAERMKEAALSAMEFSPDIIDLNFGCPVKKIVSKGCGAALLLDPDKMVEIARAVVHAVNIPVTAKTRLGWDAGNLPIVGLAEQLQDAGIAAISIHARTRAQMYSGKADWTLVGAVKNNPRMHIPVFGNGDVDSPATALEMRNRYGVDGIMIGRAAIGNPWLFREVRHYLDTGGLLNPPGLHEKIDVCLQHIHRAVEVKGERTGVLEMRRHYSGYFKGYPDFKPHRVRLLQCATVTELEELLRLIRDAYPQN
jgi:tRNA-dihydrouridine synthase B